MANQVAVEEPVPNVHEASPKRGRLRRQLYVTLPGCWGAVILAALSFIPTLLPRSGVIQGLVCGVNAAIGYGLGVLVAWVWRAFADREARTAKPSAWRGLAMGGGLLLVVSFALGQYWQHQIRDLMGVTEYNVALVVAMPVVTVVLFAILLLIGRGVRGVYRWVAGLLSRLVGPSAARATGWILVFVAVWLLVTGVLLDGLVSSMDAAFAVNNTAIKPGSVPPERNELVGWTLPGPGPSSAGTPWAGRVVPSRAWGRAPVRSRRWSTSLPRTLCVRMPAWTPPRTPSPAPRWRFMTWSGRAASSGPTSWS